VCEKEVIQRKDFGTCDLELLKSKYFYRLEKFTFARLEQFRETEQYYCLVVTFMACSCLLLQNINCFPLNLFSLI
jgi:hypothetical protein